MEFSTFFAIIIGVALINNYVLSKFLGLCPFLGVTKKMESAFGMGMAVVFVMTLASAVTWLIYNYLLREGNIFGVANLAPVLKTASYILVIASLV